MMITANDLTTEEKLRLICGKDHWNTVDFGGKIPSVRMTDGPMGVRMPVDPEKWDGVRPSVAYPSVQMLANTWSRECAREIGEALADDCKDFGADILLAPGVNIKRSPLCGRNFEYFSEDPFLAGTLAYEYICGLQQNGTGACVKHFCSNNLEYNRKEQSSEVDERTLREIYYKPFEIALKADPVAVMCSYNRINGRYAAEYKKGFRVLRGDYRFRGAVISDWSAVRDRAKSACAGLDLEMPFDEKNYEKLLRDYREGKLSDSELNECAQRVLDLIYRCKQLARNKSVKRTVEERIALTQKIEEEGIVLLKNNGVLPLKKGQKLSVCGWFARPCGYERKRPGLIAGGGSGWVERLTPAFDMVDLLSAAVGGEVAYEPAFSEDGVDSAFMIPRNAVCNASESDVNIVFAGTGAHIESEGGDRLTMKLYGEAAERTILDTAAVNPNTVVVLFAGAPIDVSAWIDRVAAVVYAGFPGERGGEAVCNVLTGKVNPSGKLSETFPLTYDDCPAARQFTDSSVTCYREGLDVGYRYFDRYGGVLFPFGYGKSYSEFIYSELQLSVESGKLSVKYKISNLSEQAGKEISQIYVRELSPVVYRPVKELKGFSKDEIPAGSEKAVAVLLEKDAFAHWSCADDCWETTDGVYEILVAASAQDIRLKAKIKITDGKITVL